LRRFRILRSTAGTEHFTPPSHNDLAHRETKSPSAGRALHTLRGSIAGRDPRAQVNCPRRPFPVGTVGTALALLDVHQQSSGSRLDTEACAPLPCRRISVARLFCLESHPNGCHSGRPNLNTVPSVRASPRGSFGSTARNAATLFRKTALRCLLPSQRNASAHFRRFLLGTRRRWRLRFRCFTFARTRRGL
jgi:hypothetical protein